MADILHNSSIKYGTPQFNLDIYTHVTLKFLDKFIVPLTSCTQGLKKFVGIFAFCM